MTANELKSLSSAELRAKADELRKSIFDLKMKLKTGRLDSTADVEKTRRDLARVLTVLRQQELGLAK